MTPDTSLSDPLLPGDEESAVSTCLGKKKSNSKARRRRSRHTFYMILAVLGSWELAELLLSVILTKLHSVQTSSLIAHRRTKETNHTDNSNVGVQVPRMVVKNDGSIAIIQPDLVTTTLTVYLVDGSTSKSHAYSIFQTDLLPKYGSGRINYQVNNNAQCDECQSPPVIPNGPCLVVRRPTSKCQLKHIQCMYPTCNYMIVNDEKCKATNDAFTIRQYFTSTLPDRVYLPLGPRHDSWMAYKRLQKQTSNDIPKFGDQPSSRREYVFNAIFSQQTDPSRIDLANIIQSHESSIIENDSSSIMANVSPSSMKIFTRMPEKWGSRQMLSTDEYVDVLSKSIFTLNPAGHNPECYRMYEAIEAGSIPIIIKSDLYPENTKKKKRAKAKAKKMLRRATSYKNQQNCKDSLIHWRTAPIVVLDSWDDLYHTVEKLTQDLSALDDMQKNLRQWYTAHMHKLVVDFENHTLTTHNAKQSIDADQKGESRIINWKSFQEKIGLVEPMSDDSGCDDILLYIPDGPTQSFENQLSNYILAAMMATFMNRSLVILDDYQQKCSETTSLSNLIQIPDWLTRKCQVPCQSTHDYLSWARVGDTSSSSSQEVKCISDNRRQTTVYVVSADAIRAKMEFQFKKLMLQSPQQFLHDWAIRLNASPTQASIFSQLQGEDDKWNYLAALVTESNLVDFHPSLVQDANNHMQQLGLDLTQAPYDAIYVRRGDELLDDPESGRWVDNYWESRGYYNRKTKTPLHSYIPLIHYARHINTMGCNIETPRHVYIVTKDHTTIEREIEDHGEPAIQFTVIPQPTDTHSMAGCQEQYENIIASIANLLVLNNSETFIGDFHSILGRLVRGFRTTLSQDTVEEAASFSDKQGLFMHQKDTRIAWGYPSLGPPGY